MTSAIALETSRGELAFALALGIVLLIIALGVNLFSAAFRARMDRADINV
jgi:tungstate transport system permease protein